MIRLSGSNKLQVVLGGAATASRVTVSYMDFTATGATGGTQLSATNGVTPVDICDAPAAATTRQVDHIKLVAKAAMTVTFSVNDGTARDWEIVTLSSGDVFDWSHSGGARVFDANGALKYSLPGFVAASGKTLTVSNTLTFAGTDGTTMTFPTTSATLARTDAANTFTGVQSMTSPDITTSITTPSTTFALVNATATTVNFAGAATTLNVGAGAASTANLAFTTAINLNTAAVNSNQTTVALLASPTTVNFAAGASTALNIGNASAAANFVGGAAIPTGKTLSGAGAINISGNITGAAISGTTGTFNPATGAGTVHVSTGTGTTTNLGLQLANVASGYAGILPLGLAISYANTALLMNNAASIVQLNAVTGGSVYLAVNNSAVLTANASGFNGVLGGTTPAAATVTTLKLASGAGYEINTTGTADLNITTASGTGGSLALGTREGAPAITVAAGTQVVTIPGTLALTATATPTGTGAGAVGQIAWDTSYLYICTATNDWRRVALADF